ncbi:MAG TPA: hypothetical protein VGW34_07635 [Allosphingosinicella sp.]|nr:hypothetical protein [Allosphingosinicella sp.]
MLMVLLLMAAEPPATGERLAAGASVRIMRGARISLAGQPSAPDRQRSRLERDGAKILILTEFQ